jgi:hypothetical protein
MGIVIGAAFIAVGVWLIIRNWDILLPILGLFVGFFLLLSGLGLLLASIARRAR